MQPNNQNPEQPTLPEQPIQSQPPMDTSMRRTIQPLSSEDDIRSEAQLTRREPVPQSSNTGSADPMNSSAVADRSTNTSNLATEPLHQQPQGVAAPSLHPSSASTSQKNGGKKIISIIVGLIIIAAVGAGVYYFFFSGKLSTANLVEATVRQTTYLRPESWKSVPLGVGIETYSDLGEGKQSVATVTIAESTASVQYYGNDRPDNWYETIRPQAMQNEKVDSIRILFRNGGKDCTSEVSFNVEPDTKVANKTVGLAMATGTCKREDGTYIVKRRTVAGEDDGMFRHITIGASESDWARNKTTYQAMLDSVGQAQTDK